MVLSDIARRLLSIRHRSETWPLGREIRYRFRSYRPRTSAAPVRIVTPLDGPSENRAGGYVHTFFDVCPFSPSQRFLAVTRLPYADRQPLLGDRADVCVVDLERQSLRVIYRTAAWGLQLGANVQWGSTDRTLYTNDIVDGAAVCVRIDTAGGEPTVFSGPMYHIAHDESRVIGVPLDLINRTQLGYGVPERPDRQRHLVDRASVGEGLWETTLASNERRLLVSIESVVTSLQQEVPNGPPFYFFHAKLNRLDSRIMQVVRSVDPQARRDRYRSFLATFDADGRNIALALGQRAWARGGHHPNWMPDGAHLLMNLTPEGDTMRFCRLSHDGSEVRVLSRRHVGTGHPSVDPSCAFLLTDAYEGERQRLSVTGWPEGEVPVRIIDLSSDEEERLCTVRILGAGSDLRLDPHPAWSRDGTMIAFNGAPEGGRAVLVADFSRHRRR